MKSDFEVNWGNIEKGLLNYKEIMSLFKCSENIDKDEVLQRRYKSFYKMNTARKDAQFYKIYFRVLKKAKEGDSIDLLSVLSHLKRISNKNEISFASKLLATIDPKLPIWDSRVRNHVNEMSDLKLKASYRTIEECVQAYNSLLSWYRDFMKTDRAKKMIAEFDSHFPNQKITSIKKVDFIFWQTK